MYFLNKKFGCTWKTYQLVVGSIINSSGVASVYNSGSWTTTTVVDSYRYQVLSYGSTCTRTVVLNVIRKKQQKNVRGSCMYNVVVVLVTNIKHVPSSVRK